MELLFLWNLIVIFAYHKYLFHLAFLITVLANKGLYSQNYGFSSSHVWVWELDHKEGRV